VAWGVEQSVARRQVEELPARLLEYAVDVGHRVCAPLVQGRPTSRARRQPWA
jgi:hypothetical protein